MNFAWLMALLRIIMGGIFLYAGYARLGYPHMIAQHLAALNLFPWDIINFFAQWMLGFEIVVGFFVISGFWLRAASILLLFFTVMCTALVSYALSCGLSLHCGCFITAATGAARTWGSLWQEGLMLAGAAVLTLSAFRNGNAARQPVVPNLNTPCSEGRTS